MLTSTRSTCGRDRRRVARRITRPAAANTVTTVKKVSASPSNVSMVSSDIT
jgi:hypothetical protein